MAKPLKIRKFNYNTMWSYEAFTQSDLCTIVLCGKKKTFCISLSHKTPVKHYEVCGCKMTTNEKWNTERHTDSSNPNFKLLKLWLQLSSRQKHTHGYTIMACTE